ncbi:MULTISPECIES: MMPL family transporter [Pontibacillus]|uniref:MMPL family transporter n=1 Tax=Pontibacillus chungwhensis TaxID=265426 RepID=A0ABY8UVP3_9BACI|nr:MULTISPECIES: MMPL family transporter [Pontibacillus]MCD5325240.1 MMPL family transporter [Pontibacillus sp. HN14]WIF97488.1 MMPL family transporter [Pontibacillus chungwhensis]
MNSIASAIVKANKGLLFFWLAIVIVFGYFALDLPSKLEGDGFRTAGEYEEVEETLNEQFGFPKSSILLLFEEEGSAFQETIQGVLDEAQDIPAISSVTSPLKDETMMEEDTAYASLNMDEDPEDMKKVIEDVRSIADEYKGVSVTGAPVISEDINKASQEDLKTAELIGLPVALLVLLLAFGSVVASIVPVIVGGMTVVIAFGVLTVLGDSVNLSVFLLNVVPMIGLALSIDFALLFINRYREELLDNEPAAAIRTTILTAGRSILFSAMCVFIGLGAMMVIQIDIFQTIALGGMVVVLIAVLTALTLLPSILFLLGHHINKWKVIRVDQSSVGRWRTFARWVMKRPILITLVALAILIVGIVPLKNMNLSIPTIESLPESYESRAAYEDIEDTFLSPDQSQVYIVAERDGDWLSQEGLEDWKTLEEEASGEDLVDSVATLFKVSEIDSSEELYQALQQEQTKEQLQPAIDRFVKGDQLLLPVTIDAKADADKAQALMRDWIDQDWAVDVSIGGQPKFNQEIYDEIYDKVGISIAIILISTFTILMLAFKSILIPLKAILMNIVGLTSTFGILVLLFQNGLFGLEETDIALVLPVLVFSLVFGLSMDYEVFLISRIHEFYQETKDNHHSTVEGLANTSKIITSAALIMIVITGAFAFTNVMPVKQIGIGIAIAIFIDATIIRLLLVPSLMKLLGDLNWWFPFQKKQRSKVKDNSHSG